jgi:nucleoside-diphosphate-sugar epimerase
MNIVLTGAFGNVGRSVLDLLLARGHQVNCLDIPSPANRRLARRYASKISLAWGDIRDAKLVQGCLTGCDAVIHLAAILPPASEADPERAWDVNVRATEQLLRFGAAQAAPPLFLLASSFAVFGHRQASHRICTVDDELHGVDHYSRQKIACEELVRSLSARWCILRLGSCIDEHMVHATKAMVQLGVDLACDNRTEFVHPADVALAFANALTCPEAHGKVHLIGGGKDCQVRHLDMMNVMSEAMGVPFEPADFGKQELYADWADTSASQALLQFQRTTFADLRARTFARYRWRRYLVRPFAPLLKRGMRLWLRA